MRLKNPLNIAKSSNDLQYPSVYIYVYFKIDEYLDFYTLHRTKFVSDDWMVNMGYMEKVVDENDKWLDTCTCTCISYEYVFLKHEQTQMCVGM